MNKRINVQTRHTSLMAMAASSRPKFHVRRQPQELLSPAEPTPYEWKEVSDIDDQDGLRFNLKGIVAYSCPTMSDNMARTDYADAVRRGFSKALVYYYPFVGRLREGPKKKLTIECTGEGILFCEADADTRLEELDVDSMGILPPFPCMDKLFTDHPSSNIVETALVAVQFTRFACGGLVLALSYNHVIADGPGYNMFVAAAAELARGAASPCLLPVWERERLRSRTPHRIAFVHHEYILDDPLSENQDISRQDEQPWVQSSVVFTSGDVAALRAQIPDFLEKSASSFDVIAACLWRCRTVALGVAADEVSRLMIAVNSRSKFDPPLPKGHYGNCVMFPAAVSEARKLVGSDLGYAVALVREAKGRVTEEYARSAADFLVLNGRTHYVRKNAFVLSDLRRAADFSRMDFGWGKPAYGGPAEAGDELISFVARFKNGGGEEVAVVPICLPVSAMEKFKVEVKKTISFPISSEKMTPSRHREVHSRM